MFLWDRGSPGRSAVLLHGEPLFLSQKQSECQPVLKAPTVRIAFKVQIDPGAHVQGVTTLAVDAKLGNYRQQPVGIEFAMDYVTVAGKLALFPLGPAKPGPDDTFVLTGDSSKQLPQDRNPAALNVSLVAGATAAHGSKLWEGRDTPRAFLPVRLG